MEKKKRIKYNFMNKYLNKIYLNLIKQKILKLNHRKNEN